jgi:hypothetical protein
MDLLQSLRALDGEIGDWLDDAADNDPQRPAMLALRNKVDDAIQLVLNGRILNDAALLATYTAAFQKVTTQLDNVGTAVANLQTFADAIGTVSNTVSQIVTALSA